MKRQNYVRKPIIRHIFIPISGILWVPSIHRRMGMKKLAALVETGETIKDDAGLWWNVVDVTYTVFCRPAISTTYLHCIHKVTKRKTWKTKIFRYGSLDFVTVKG